MATYRVTTDSININSGIVGLNPSQVHPRLHRLAPLGNNRYDVKDPPVTFKRGEIFNLEGELPKELVQSVSLEEAEGWASRPPAGLMKPKKPVK